MSIQLSEQECRVIGVLMEKSVTTPEQYPLTVNALNTGCNQKSNRYPVTSFSEATLRDVLAGLTQKRLISLSSGFGSRVDKISQRFCNTEFADLKFTSRQFAVITELLLRGAQTQGELRGRCQRLAHFDHSSDVEDTLKSLLNWQPDPLIYALPREPGKREVRYAHCFSGKPSEQASPHTPEAPAETGSQHASLADELRALKATVAALEQRVSELEDKAQD